MCERSTHLVLMSGAIWVQFPFPYFLNPTRNKRFSSSVHLPSLKRGGDDDDDNGDDGDDGDTVRIP